MPARIYSAVAVAEVGPAFHLTRFAVAAENHQQARALLLRDRYFREDWLAVFLAEDWLAERTGACIIVLGEKTEYTHDEYHAWVRWALRPVVEDGQELGPTFSHVI